MNQNQYPLKELVKRWEREELTVEQAVGQILLWLIDLSKRVSQSAPPQPEKPDVELP